MRHAEDDLAPRRRLLLDDEPVEVDVAGFAHASAHVVDGTGDRRVVAQIEDDAANVRLVDDARVGGLEHDGVTDPRCGTHRLVGVARTLKPRKPSLRIIGVEPESAPFVSTGEWRPHRMMGTAPGFLPGVLEREALDDIMLVSEEEAFEACRQIAHSEGLLVGISSGATAVAARRLIRDPDWEGKTVVCVFCDSGERYLSVDGLFSA